MDPATEIMRVLIVEDLPSDAELCEREVKQVLDRCEFLRVETREEFIAALASFRPRLIVSDFKLPHFDGMTALKLALERAPETPFIMLTGSMNEDTAVECMKAGAWDYVIKEHIKRLGSAVLAALEQKHVRDSRKRAETDLRLSLELLDATQRLARIGGWEWNLERQTMTWTDETYRIHGMTPGEPAGGSPEHIDRSLACYDPADRPVIEAAFRRCAAEGQPYDLEFPLTRIDGRRIWIRTMAHAVKEGHRVVNVIGSIIDLTERKRAEETLRESERFSRNLIESMGDGFSILDENGVHIDVNPAFCRMTGFTPEELIGSGPPHPYWPEEEYGRIQIVFSKMMKGGFDDFELIFKKKNGERFPVIVTPSKVEDARGGVTSYFATVKDITERKRAEALLRIKDTAVASAIAGIAIADLDGRIGYVNAAWLHMHGHDSDAEVMGTTPLQHVRNPADGEAVIKALKQEGFWTGEMVCRRRDGSYFTAEIATNLMTDLSGRPMGMLASFKDISERKLSRDRLTETLERLRQAVSSTIRVLGLTVEARDPYTAGHQQRATKLAVAIAEELGLPSDRIEGLRLAGEIHDIGKISLPSEILSKPTRLTPFEFDLIKTHPKKGYDILKGVEFPWPLAEIVHQHHERIDGSGYPRGLLGTEILLEARILAVADTVEAMASHRPYRCAPGIDAALREIEKSKGVLYDDEVASACLRVIREKGFAFDDPAPVKA